LTFSERVSAGKSSGNEVRPSSFFSAPGAASGGVGEAGAGPASGARATDGGARSSSPGARSPVDGSGRCAEPHAVTTVTRSAPSRGTKRDRIVPYPYDAARRAGKRERPEAGRSLCRSVLLYGKVAAPTVERTFAHVAAFVILTAVNVAVPGTYTGRFVSRKPDWPVLHAAPEARWHPTTCESW
jgi:hypothetical protein